MALSRTRTGTPRLRCTDDVLYYWAERIEQVAPAVEWFSYSSMICRGDSLFHYGTHFELARIVRDKRGRAKLVLLNGDSYGGASGFGPSTSSRQSDARRAVNATNVPGLVVPFSALEGAGIDFTTITPIHVRADRETIEEHSSRKRPTNRPARMPDPSGATHIVKGYRWDAALQRHEYGDFVEPVYVDDPERTAAFSAQHGWCADGARRDEQGIWHWRVRRHWLGDSIFRARSTETRTRPATAAEREQAERHRVWEAESARLDREQRALYQRARALDTRWGFDRDYRRMTRAMFAAEGFREAADRAWEAYNEHRSNAPRTNVRNGRVPITVTRWATYLSSFDYQEPRALYFLCELPYGAKPNTVDEAIESLKPPEVVAAEARGLKVVRQGDLFAIPTKLTKRQIRRMRGRHDFTKRLRILGTNHSVTEGIVCKGGAVLGRGIMRHEPESWRQPDHRAQKLGKTWHLLVRNTVPRTQ